MIRCAPVSPCRLGLMGLLGLLATAPLLATDTTIVTVSADDARRLGVETASIREASRIVVPGQPGMVQVPNDRILVLTSPAEAVLTRLLVAEGQAVTTGDALAEIAGPGIAALESTYRDAAGEYALRRAERDRTAGLVADGVLPARASDEAEVRLQRAAGELEGARLALAAAGVGATRLEALRSGAVPASSLVLRAPGEGYVLRQFARPGERLELGTPLLELGRLDLLWVEAHVPLDRVRGFTPGDSARIQGGAGQVLTGRVVALGRRVHEADRGLLVRVVVEDPAGVLIPGQPVRVALERAAPAQSLEIATAALVMLANESAVFVRRNDGFEVVPVVVLAEREDSLIVRGTLGVGDLVAVRGTAALKALVDRGGAGG